MTMQPTAAPRPSPTKACRAFCRLCLPEPKGEYLRCPTIECPLWRFRTGNINRVVGSKSLASLPDALSRAMKAPKSPAFGEARAKILMAEAQVKADGKPHVSDVEWWGPDHWPGYRTGERAVRAIRRMCVDCCGTRDVKTTCCSPDCALAPFRFGRRPRPGDPVPVPNIPDYLKGTSRV